jgi:hypothetical protein
MRSSFLRLRTSAATVAITWSTHSGTSSFGVRYVYDEPHGIPGILGQVVAMVAVSSLTMPIARTYLMTDAGAAHRDSQTGHVRGKLALTWTTGP